MLVRKIIQYIEEKQLLSPQDKVLVALSGGADSVALLCVLQRAGYEIVAAHCNFHLRGEESNRDEAFVRELCARMKVEVEVTHFDTLGYATSHGCSVEMAARELRYAWFEALRVRVGAAVVAVAHHKDDSVETFLLNLLRGTGIKGLRGIRPVNGKIIRPLLEVSRQEILDYLAWIHQDYVTDSTNLETDFTRNKIRLEVLPLLQQINPSVCDTLYETASRLTEVEKIYRSAVAEAVRRISLGADCFSIPQLKAEVSPQAVLFELLSPYGFNTAQVADVYDSLYTGESGRLFYTKEYVLLRDRDRLVLKARNLPAVRYKLCVEVKSRNEVDLCFSDKSKAFLDTDQVKNSLTLRKWQSGDRFIPFGMKGFKKVRDYLRDRKFSIFEKEEQYVVCAGREIVWLVGERTDQRFSVTADTVKVMILSVQETQAY